MSGADAHVKSFKTACPGTNPRRSDAGSLHKTAILLNFIIVSFSPQMSMFSYICRRGQSNAEYILWKRAQHYNPGQNKMEQQTHIHHETARTLTCEYRCHFLLLAPQERGEKAVFAGYANAKTRHLPLFGRVRRGLNFPCFAQELVQVGKYGVSVALCVPNISLC